TSNPSPTTSFFAIPTPPATCSAPVADVVASVVSTTLAVPPTKSFLAIPTPPVTTSAPSVDAVASVVPPTKRLLVIPTPPATTSAPVAYVVGSVVSCMLTTPAATVAPAVVTARPAPAVILVPTNRFLAMPTPPLTISAPSVDAVASVVS